MQEGTPKDSRQYKDDVGQTITLYADGFLTVRDEDRQIRQRVDYQDITQLTVNVDDAGLMVLTIETKKVGWILSVWKDQDKGLMLRKQLSSLAWQLS